jgi:KDO2-lipid IV(A) lauroyltransferase
MRLALLVGVNLILTPLYLSLYCIALLVTCLPIFPSRVGLENLRNRLGSGFFKAHFQLAQVFLNYIFYLIETLVIWPLGLTCLRNEGRMTDFIRQIFTKYKTESGGGVMFLSGHFGNIESIGQVVSSLLQSEFHRGLYALAQPSRSRLITAILSWYRNRRGLPTLMTGGATLFPAIEKAVKEGAAIAILADQKPRRNGLFVTFFGTPAAFPYRGIELGVRLEAPFIYMMARRIVPGYFEPLFAEGINSHLASFSSTDPVPGNSAVRLAPVLQVEGKTRASQHTETVLAGYVGWLEDLVRKDPLQWFWDYKKWSRRPTA